MKTMKTLLKVTAWSLYVLVIDHQVRHSMLAYRLHLWHPFGISAYADVLILVGVPGLIYSLFKFGKFLVKKLSVLDDAD